MNKVLIIYAAPTPKEVSHTATLINQFLKHYVKYNPDDEFIWLDLNEEKDITNNVLNRNNFSEFFNKSDKYINQLKEVNKVIVATPMNNFMISTLLKNYIDYIMVAKKTFEYKYVNGLRQAVGLLDHLKVQILANQGAPADWYPWGKIVTYLEGCFNFIGATINKSILVDGTKTAKYKDKTLDELIIEFDGTISDSAKTF